MSRTERLLQLMQYLRRHRTPVSGQHLADAFAISLRTLYRDIASLQAQGATIEGEAGVGYVLRPGSSLPPLMFSSEEIEALVLGARWVAERTDTDLALAAKNSLAKIAAVLPQDLRYGLETSGLLIGSGTQRMDEAHLATLAILRKAIRSERKLRLSYCDLHENTTERVVWPFALGFFDAHRVLTAWCETRGDVRHFRTDRMLTVVPLDEPYPRRRALLLKEWLAREDIPPQ